jgi:hypothetical protein
MRRNVLIAAGLAMLAGVLPQTANAQGRVTPAGYHCPNCPPGGQGQYDMAGRYCPPSNRFAGYQMGGYDVARSGNGMYPQLDASLYPCPRGDIPHEVGGSIITNAAFYPHEMMYAHRYKAVYPPYYYQTNWRYGLRWTMCKTPVGVPLLWLKPVKVASKTKLVGTCVKVEYKDHISPFAFFWPPTNFSPFD